MKDMLRVFNMPDTEVKWKNVSKLQQIRCPRKGELEHLTLMLMKEFAGVNKSNMHRMTSTNGIERLLMEHGMHDRKTFLSVVITGLNLNVASEIRKMF